MHHSTILPNTPQGRTWARKFQEHADALGKAQTNEEAANATREALKDINEYKRIQERSKPRSGDTVAMASPDLLPEYDPPERPDPTWDFG